MPSTELQTEIDEAAEDAGQNMAIDELANSEEEVTADALRGILGDSAKDVSDEELLETYAKAGEEEEVVADETPVAAGAEVTTSDAETPEAEADEAPVWDRPWDLVDAEGNKVTDVESLSFKELMDLKIGYKAGGEDQSRGLDEIVRLAQRAPMDEERLRTLQQQRNDAADKYIAQQATLAELEKDKEFALWVFSDPTGGRFSDALKKFESKGFGDAPPADAEPEIDPSLVSRERMARGEEVLRTSIRPRLEALARSVSADGELASPENQAALSRELEEQFLVMAAAEGHYLDDPSYGPARVQQMLNEELPHAVAVAGYRAVKDLAITEPTTEGLVALQAEVENLKTELAKARVSEAPDAGGGSIPSGSPKGPSISDKLDKMSWKEMKKFMDSDEYKEALSS